VALFRLRKGLETLQLFLLADSAQMAGGVLLSYSLWRTYRISSDRKLAILTIGFLSFGLAPVFRVVGVETRISPAPLGAILEALGLTLILLGLVAESGQDAVLAFPVLPAFFVQSYSALISLVVGALLYSAYRQRGKKITALASGAFLTLGLAYLGYGLVPLIQLVAYSSVDFMIMSIDIVTVAQSFMRIAGLLVLIGIGMKSWLL